MKDMIQRMQNVIKILFVALFLGAPSIVLAVETLGTKNGVTVYVDKIPSGGGTVSLSEVTNVTDAKRVTLTIVTAAGYNVSANLITAEPIVVLESSPAPKRAPGLMDPLTITANSETSYSFDLPSDYNAAFVTVRFNDGSVTGITDLDQITDLNETGNYELVSDIDASAFAGLGEFKGSLDGHFHKITNLSKPLFSILNGGMVKNVTFEGVSISSGDTDGDAGAVCSKATGSARIYNCGILPTSTERDDEGNITGFSGSSISGSGNVGGLVGTLSGNARVINCFSYANITGGTNRAGIVGYNNETSTQASLTTMVMNCMFYGDISTGGTISPIYGGTEINNVSGGLNNYNYYRYESPYSENKYITKYNRALAMEEKFITRFERYRLLLNSNKKLAAIYATGSAANANQMAKWILEAADRQITNPMPYPVLRKREQNKKYPSIINYDAEHAPDSTMVGRLNGGKVSANDGKLTVTILTKSEKTTGGQSWPTAAASDVQTTSLTLIRTDKDTTRFNFNYDKVQLPYYNDVGTGNYTENRVVTGWKIVEIVGGTPGTYTEADEWGGYNFADRNCTNKDKYGVSKRVFSQGAYWDVPKDVTAITIEPYWAIANYVSDETYDVVYDKDYNKKTFTTSAPFGTQYSNNTDIDIYGDGNNQKVYTSISSALAGFDNDSKMVYDQAVVLVGNVHQYASPTASDIPYTVMSIDMNHDNEPDYSYIFSHNNRRPISPIRYDFLNIMGIAEAQIPNEAELLCNVSICNLKGWFEITNTCLVNFSQFEYENSEASQNYAAKSPAPLILLGGTYEQFVSTQKTSRPASTKYIHVGSNAWFAEFGNGTHSDGNGFTPHIPISVTGGDYDGFYLSGTYQPTIENMESDNAECYISGGRFGEVAGASLEAIWGDVRWDINWADITNFYGGGVNGVNPITGDIRVDMTNSYVNRYCGGPKFGDMTDGKAVTTNATDCVFGTYFGAGFGGNAYNRVKYRDESGKEPADYQNLYESERGKYFDGSTTVAYTTHPDYGKKGKGVATDFDSEFFIWSTGVIGARFFVKFVTFSLATTHGVTSKLTNCKVTGNVYGGGSLGMVEGDVSTTLDGCEISGNVFGGGYSATLPTVDVRKTPAFIAGKEPTKNMNIGLFEPGEINTTEEYEWKQVASTDLSNGGTGMVTEDGKNYVYTDTNLSALGTVTGNVTLNISGTTTVGGSVYGGGEESNVSGDTQVNVNATYNETSHKWESTSGSLTITGDVFGAGKGVGDNFACDKAMVGVNDDGKCKDPGSDTNKDKGTIVRIGNGTVNGNVYGGGKVGRVEWNTQVTIGIEGEDSSAPVVSGSVFGAGAGLETHGYSALVRGNSTVTVQGSAKVLHNVYGGGEKSTVGRYWVKGIETTLCPDDPNETAIPTPPTDLPDGMPYQQRRGGICNVVIRGKAQIGPDSGGTEDAGHVFGAGKGVTPIFVESGEGKSQKMTQTGLADFTADATHETAEDAYLEFLQTLSLVTNSNVTIDGSAKVKGSVYGGSESGYVQHDTKVTVSGGTIGTENKGGADFGNVYGGGKGDAEHTGTNNNYLAAGIVKGCTKVKIEDGTILHNIYGGGAYGSVGVFDYNATTGLPTGLKATAPTNSGKTEIYITGGTIGTTGKENGMIFGSSRGDVGAPNSIHDKLAWVYDTHVAIGDTTENATITTAAPLIRGSIYGGGENGHNLNNAYVRINGGTIGVKDNTTTEVTYKDDATDPTRVTYTGYEYNYPYRGNVYGGGCGTDTYKDSAVDKYNPLAGVVKGNAYVKITAGYIVHNVYGAGAMGSVGTDVADAKTKVNISGGRIGYDGSRNGNVFGAARGEYGTSTDLSKNLANVRETEVNISYTTTPTGDNDDKDVQLIAGSVFGGGESGTVKENVTVTMTGGLILKDLYGGGALADTQTSNWNTAATPNTWADADKKSALNTTTIRLTGGRVVEEVFGGGLGEEGKPAYVWGDVLVDLNGTTPIDGTTYKPSTTGTATTNAAGCVVGQLFGGNNINGTPKGDVMVHVYATQNKEKASISAKFKLDNESSTDKGTSESDDDYVARLKEILADKIEVAEALGLTVSTDDKNLTTSTTATADDLKTAITTVTTSINTKTTDEINAVRYDVKAVYGGGNQAAYVPVTPNTSTTSTPNGAQTQVIIEGCEYTSIETVYGGGNAAAVPETNVEVRSAYEIGMVFGGGNGKDDIAPGVANPGADVGVYKEGTTETTYGTGYANAILKGGFIHEAYGGSNQKGNIKGKININTNPQGTCDLCVDKLVGAGKNADVDGDLIMILGCKPTTKTPLVFAGADNANVNGNVELTITSGTFGQVFGGNNLGGAIKGHIKLNIEETGCTPINIDELYLGGNQAAYSVYGYYEDASDGNKLKPRTAEMQAVASTDANYIAPVANPSNDDGKHPFPYDQPVLNVVSCTSIGKVFGGGLGTGAKMYADPTVNINMIKGTATGSLTTLGTIGDVFGGGNAASVIGNTTVNIGTETTVTMTSVDADDPNTTDVDEKHPTVLGANITGNVYGGGQLADVGQYDVANDHVDVAGNTYVNIGAKYNTTTEKWESVTPGTSGVTIAGNVFGGGEGEAAESGTGAFKCVKAIVTGGTNIHIGNGTINGTVYGGGEVGRVEGDAEVAIGIEAGGTTPASAPIIAGDVFGAGKGKKTHGYSALMRGNPTVTIEGDAKVRGSVYGGGEIASVGRYKVKKAANDPADAPDDVLNGMPYSLANSGSGYCTVNIRGNAEIGPETAMQMTKAGGPDDTGHVIGGGKGVLPYDGYGVDGDDWKTNPWRVDNNDNKDTFSPTSSHGANYEKEYFKYIETLALATETNVTISGNAFVKGSVYGGSLNGHVQHDTHVNIAGDCQIGAGDGITKRYTEQYAADVWTNRTAYPTLPECSHWIFDKDSGAPYDPMATTTGSYDYNNYGFVPDSNRKSSSEGGRPVAKDGHTYYGNVFGGGSGVIPYAPGLWHRGAGSVGGDTYVNITGGHILTSVYGGNEHTDVGTYTKDASGQPTTTPAATNARGKCTVNMTGGTVGVPRTLEQIQAHPVTGYVFGAGKGDQRIFFNTWTNVIDTEVNISGNALIYGSTFGGGEDGHVIGDAETNIGNVTIKTGKDANDHEITTDVNANGLVIGTIGTSYVDGNVFGGGRGFSGEAQTAGTVGGNVRLNINAGSVYGSVYGGGRLASVGTMFEYPTLTNGNPNPAYGQFKKDGSGKTYGHVTINISGGTIGNENATGDGAKYSGNVFGGSMGRLNLLDGTTRNPIWPKMAQVKSTEVNIYGEAVVRRNVYGGGELGTVRDDAYVTIGGYKTADADADGNVTVTKSSGTDSKPTTVRRDVFGGGYGSEDMTHTLSSVYELTSATADPADPDNYGSEPHIYAYTPMQFAGCVGKNTYVNVAGGYIRKSVYGGGEMASVGVINYRAAELSSGDSKAGKVWFHDDTSNKDYYYTNMVKHDDVNTQFALSWPYKFEYVTGYDGATHVKITGGRLGLTAADTDTGFEDNGDVYGAGKGLAGDYKDYLFCANVGSTDVKVAYGSTPTAYSHDGECIAGAVYGGGEDGHVMGDTKLTISGGLIYHSVYGGGSGKGKFPRKLLLSGKTYGSTNDADYENRDAYSITAGKVFGNTEVNMSGGYVVRNIYGGGNMGSVGIGNYAGGTGDYSTAGYGEKVADLWSNADFLGSGKCTVKITGGTIGYIDTTTPSNSMYPWNSSASLPYGNVFGGCRGEAVPNITDSPRYYYCPEFFVGYANETEVTIEGDDTKILGSVYGGGMDGHIRRDASVIIKGGEIGKPFDDTNKGILGANPENIQWLARGNVYGAGSGIGKYGDEFCTSAGSVTRFTTVDIQGGKIHRNVYGGGSLASIGAPKIPANRTDNPTRTQTLNTVTISGGQIGGTYSYNAGNHVYGGHVFGGSRGDASLDATKFSTSMFTSITIDKNADETKNPVIEGSVFGGGEVGIVKGSVDVTVNGGTINDDVYGGGALANTNTENSSTGPYTTTVNLYGGLVKGDAYGGGLGQLGVTGSEAVYYTQEEADDYNAAHNLTPTDAGYVTTATIKTPAIAAVSAVPALVYGDVAMNLGDAGRNGATAFNVEKYTEGTHAGIVKSGRVFGCNNLNGSPQGTVTVTVNKTVEGNTPKTASGDLKSSDATKHSYHVAAVYGGGNLAGKTVGGSTYVVINGCDVSIRDVYGGGNAAEVPATDVLVNGAYEIEHVFGGGNGKDDYTLDGGATWTTNPGANVNGNTNTLLLGGLIHEAYGGSNEKGTILGSVSINTGSADNYPTACTDCPLDVEKIVGAGKNADVNGDLIMVLGCKPTTLTPLVFGGADNANVNGNVELTITSGTFGQVFGGNNLGGVIRGHIILNIEETGCNPIKINELYLGGNNAAYSRYGYYNAGDDTNPDIKPRTAEMHAITNTTDPNYKAPVGNPTEDARHPFPYDQPVLNVVSCTSIGKVFGGGLGTGAIMHADPTVNINMIQGAFANDETKGVPAVMTEKGLSADDNPNKLGIIGDVYGGGNAADVIGNPTVNIGTAATVKLHKAYNTSTKEYTEETKDVVGAYINGNVFGAGMGKADEFECEKAMVGVKDKGFGSTHVTIENGTVNGNVYGGGQIGRVEHDTWVTIGKEGDETNSPVVKGDVFGAGKGLKTHGYSALVRGKATVTVQGKAHVEGSVYGGGEIASVGKYKVKKAKGDPADAPDWVPVGMPYSLYDETSESGNCNVVVRDNAIIGPETPMQMKKTGGPDDTGHVFGAGKGVLPYEGYGVAGDDWASVPWRMAPDNSIDNYSATDYVGKGDGLDYKAAYLQFIETLALATETNVTITGNAFVKGSVYGGSMNGHVQHHTRVTIAGGQIGAGDGMSQPYKETDWTGETTPAGGWKECAHWDYVDNGAPYDPLATAEGKYDYTNYPFIPEADRLTSSEGGLPTATDGHTYYGNVFGGGSGVIPYAPGLWHRASGSVGGDSYVTITGGHILTSVYGGNEQTDVGTYTKADPTVPATGGKCTVTMTGGTVGVPLEHKENYPVTGHLFGAGKGDKRILFNTWTNVAETEVNVSGGTIYGNVYGGGEDGHVMSLSKMTISEADATTNPTIIGTTGTSGYDGDVFGGGQGSVTALTAGVVGGNVNLSIEGGTMKGSVYGGGRLASVGTFFAMASAANYGRMQDGDDHGNIVVNLTGGTIKQNVFGGCMGSTTDNRLGVSKNVTVNLNGYETTTGETTTTVIVADDKKGCVVKGSVFGCNNLESSPLGDVLVHVYGTQKDGASQIANTAGSGETAAVENAKTPATQVAGEFDLSSFDVKAVYGGGNLAAYKPQGPNVTSTDYDYANTTHFAKVIIDGCGRTSIGQVYGGGNAASTPATEVTVNGTYEIGELFGGGNGKDDVTINGVTKPNPGANVGYYNYSQYVEKDGKTIVEDMPAYDTKAKRIGSDIQYGTGKAAVNIFGGTIHRVFGGSNTKGNVCQSAITLLEEAGGCAFCVDEAYGGGKSAPMDAEAKLLMACIPGLKEVYGGAQAADVYDDVTVTVTNGNFDRVFGGNNLSGTIRGKITVNVEETGCRPVIIGELYGGGNQAGYSVYGYNDDGTIIESGEKPLYADPQVNVRSFTSIGTIYGGGYGAGATMVANPTVNINESVGNPDNYPTTGDYDDNGFKGKTITVDGHEVTLPSHTKGKIGAINNVFGGGNAAKVIGNTNVNVGTETTQTYVSVDDNPATETKENVKEVKGADIRGNVYGGGNNAEVTGNTNVQIGQKK